MQTLHQLLSSKGLKVTPQRLAVYEAVVSMRTHPTADKIIAYVQHRHPNIAVGTIYNVLEALVDKGWDSVLKQRKILCDMMQYWINIIICIVRKQGKYLIIITKN